MYFVDVDSRDECFIQHLRDAHPNKYMWRYSSTKGVHAVVDGIACEVCQNFRDPRYDGNIFFDNKGIRWAGEWHGTMIDKRPSLLICRIMNRTVRYQKYIGLALGWGELMSYKVSRSVQYCFHSIRIFPGTKLSELESTYQDEEEENGLAPQEYLQLYDMHEWKGDKKEYEDNMIAWLNTMPTNPLGFVYKEEDLK